MTVGVYYFSNGTEGSLWSAEWCERCTHDHTNHGPDATFENGCPHIVSMLTGSADDVFVRTMNDRGYTDLQCIAYSRCTCDNGPGDPPGEPPPPPVDPNQGALFDVEAVTPGVWRDVVLDTLTPAEVTT